MKVGVRSNFLDIFFFQECFSEFSFQKNVFVNKQVIVIWHLMTYKILF